MTKLSTILRFTFEYSKTAASQIRTLKTISRYWMLHRWCAYFGCSGAEPLSLILRSVLRLSISCWTLSLFVSLPPLSPPPPPLISSQAQEATGVHARGQPPGRMRRRCLQGTALLCPHHWLLRKSLHWLVEITLQTTEKKILFIHCSICSSSVLRDSFDLHFTWVIPFSAFLLPPPVDLGDNVSSTTFVK